MPLEADGAVGKNTRWALENPSGEKQRNHFRPAIPNGLARKRRQLLEMVFEGHSKPVFEVRDDSNRNRTVLIYLGVALTSFGAILLVVDWAEGMLLFWRIWEGPFDIAFGLTSFF